MDKKIKKESTYEVTEQELLQLDQILANTKFEKFKDGLIIQQWIINIHNKKD